MSVNIIHVRMNVFGNVVGVLQSDFETDSILFTVHVNDVFVQRIAGSVDVLDVFDDASFVVEFVAFSITLILEDDSYAAVQES